MFSKDPLLNSIAEAYKKMSKDMMDFQDEAYGKVYSVKKEDANEFITKAAAAKKAGQSTFKFGDKTYPVTIKIDPDKILEAEKAMKDASSKKAKVTVNPTDDDLRENSGESVVNEENARLNKKVKTELDSRFGRIEQGSPDHQLGIMVIMMGALKSLSDKNFSRKASSLDKFFPKANQSKHSSTDAMASFMMDVGKDLARLAKNDGNDIIDAFADYTSKTMGQQMGQKLQSLKESTINEMTDMEMVADQLVNAVEDGIIGKDEFADFLSQETKFDKKSLGKVYDAYLDLDPRKRMKMLKTRDMMKFLKDRGLKEEVVNEGNVKLPSSAKKFWNTPPEKLIKTYGNDPQNSIPPSQWNTHPEIIDAYGQNAGVDIFKQFIRDNLVSNDRLDPKLAKMIGLPTNVSIIDYLNDGGSGLNGNKNFKKYGNWFSALYDIYEEMERKFGRVKAESVVNEGKFKKDDLVYNKKTKRVNIVRTPDEPFDAVELDVDGAVDVKHVEKFNHDKHSGKAKVEKSTEKEINKRGLYQPFKPKNESVVNERRRPPKMKKGKKEDEIKNAIDMVNSLGSGAAFQSKDNKDFQKAKKKALKAMDDMLGIARMQV